MYGVGLSVIVAEQDHIFVVRCLRRFMRLTNRSFSRLAASSSLHPTEKHPDG